MKKLVMFFALMLISFLLVGCNAGGSDLDLNYTEIAGVPSNLKITNKILSWDIVTEASKYIVYANGVEVATVKTNSYDFSSLSGSVLIFQVQTDAKRGYQNSGLSVSIAYVVNKTTEITAVTALAEDSFGELPPGFAQALVEKGMTSSEFEDMSADMSAFVDSIGTSEGDIIAISNALQTLIATDINFEAIINGFLLFVPELINTNIDDLQDQIDEYESYIELYGDYGSYYQDQIDEFESQKQMYLDLQTAIESSHDDVILSALHTVQYFISIINQLDSDFFTKIENMMSADNPSDLETSEIILIKEELSAAMLDNMPSVQDMVVLFELITAMSSSASGETAMVSYPTENAAQALLSIEAFAKMIDTIDADFIEALKSFYAEDPDSYQVEALILAVKYFDRFQKDNDRLIEEMRTVLSFNQQKALFDDYLSALSGMDEAEIALSDYVLDLISFQDFYNLGEFAYDLMDPILEWFVYTDGEMVRLSYQQSLYDSEANYTLAEYNAKLDQVEMLKYVSQLLALITDEMDSTFSDSLSGVIASLLFVEGDSSGNLDNLNETDAVNLHGDVRDNLESEMMTFITLLNLLFEKANSADLFDDLYDLEVDLNTYAIGEYGANYLDSNLYFDDMTSDYAHTIFFAKFLAGYLSSTNQNRVEDVMNMVFDTMMLDDFVTVSGISSEEVELMQLEFFDNFDYLVSQSNKIKNYDPFDMTSSEISEVEDFLYTFG